MLILAAGTAALAHDLELSFRLHPPAVVARATYAGTAPAPFAKVTIYAPSGGPAFQSGNADRNGAFSFLPDGPGVWRISVDDEMGHVTEAKVEVPQPFEGVAVASTGEPPRWPRALMGLLGIAGAAGLLYGYRSRRTVR